jgi:hypothetical protein
MADFRDAACPSKGVSLFTELPTVWLLESSGIKRGLDPDKSSGQRVER